MWRFLFVCDGMTVDAVEQLSMAVAIEAIFGR
jgi:hypothetical protein